MAALLVWNRWSPGRLVLVMAFIFTVIVSAVSLINLGYFNFGRKAAWLWFLVYLASAAVSGLFLWRARAHPSAKGVTLNPAWRGYMLAETAILGLYGVGMLLFPRVVSSSWPWPVDPFHAQVYSAIFLAGAGGTYLVWKSAPREELLAAIRAVAAGERHLPPALDPGGTSRGKSKRISQVTPCKTAS